jgi:tetratricopeptide (TPR) repeat protein
VRAAQGRDDEAEELLRESVEGFVENGLTFAELQALDELGGFLRARGRVEEAAAYEERALALAPAVAPSPT